MHQPCSFIFTSLCQTASKVGSLKRNPFARPKHTLQKHNRPAGCCKDRKQCGNGRHSIHHRHEIPTHAICCRGACRTTSPRCTPPYHHTRSSLPFFVWDATLQWATIVRNRKWQERSPSNSPPKRHLSSEQKRFA